MRSYADPELLFPESAPSAGGGWITPSQMFRNHRCSAGFARVGGHLARAEDRWPAACRLE